MARKKRKRSRKGGREKRRDREERLFLMAFVVGYKSAGVSFLLSSF